MDEKINLMWKSNNESFNVGELLFSDSRYYFNYNVNEVKKAKEYGLELLEGFPRVNSKYFSEEMFKLFQKWLVIQGRVEDVTFETLKGLSYDNFYFENGARVEANDDITD